MDPRRAVVERLATRAWSRLVAVARAEAGPEGAEDAVQDVLLRLAAGAGDLPLDEGRATAYATTAVRRAARAGAQRRVAVADRPDATAADAAPEERLEARRRLVAFARALDAVPPAQRRTVALDAAGYGRAEIATAVGASERAVKRALAEHRAPVLAATLAALDGTDCARFADTLTAYGAGAGRPRRGGPVAAHLEVCDACRAGLRRAAAVRRTLRAALGLPLAPAALATAGAGVSLTALVGALKLPLAIVALAGAATAGTVGVVHAVGGGRPPVARVAPAATVPTVVVAPAARPAPAVVAAPATPAARPGTPRPVVVPTVTPATRATREPVAARATRPVATTIAAGAAVREGTAQRARPARPPRTTRPARPATTATAPRMAPAVTSPPPPAAPAAAPCAQQGLCAP